MKTRGSLPKPEPAVGVVTRQRRQRGTSIATATTVENTTSDEEESMTAAAKTKRGLASVPQQSVTASPEGGRSLRKRAARSVTKNLRATTSSSTPSSPQKHNKDPSSLEPLPKKQKTQHDDSKQTQEELDASKVAIEDNLRRSKRQRKPSLRLREDEEEDKPQHATRQSRDSNAKIEHLLLIQSEEDSWVGAAPDPQAEQKELMLQQARMDGRILFERQKAKVLARLPQSVKDSFGEIGFAKWGRQYLPALVRSPYDVPPGKVRRQWMEQYKGLRRHPNSEKLLEDMNRLVYWYGVVKPSDYYSFVKKDAFISYQDATTKQRGFAGPALKKQQAGKKLSGDDVQKLRAHFELEQDLQKHPSDRRRGVVDFKEGYDLLEDIDFDVEVNNNSSAFVNDDDSLSLLSFERPATTGKPANDDDDEKMEDLDHDQGSAKVAAKAAEEATQKDQTANGDGGVQCRLQLDDENDTPIGDASALDKEKSRENDKIVPELKQAIEKGNEEAAYPTPVEVSIGTEASGGKQVTKETATVTRESSLPTDSIGKKKDDVKQAGSKVFEVATAQRYDSKPLKSNQEQSANTDENNEANDARSNHVPQSADKTVKIDNTAGAQLLARTSQERDEARATCSELQAELVRLRERHSLEKSKLEKERDSALEELKRLKQKISTARQVLEID